MNRLKRFGLSSILPVIAMVGCPDHNQTNPISPSVSYANSYPQNEFFLASVGINSEKTSNNYNYDFYSSNGNSIDTVVISHNEKSDFDELILQQDWTGRSKYVKGIEGYGVKLEGITSNNTVIITAFSPNNTELGQAEIPYNLISKDNLISKEFYDKIETEFICDSIGDLTRNYNLVTKFSSLLTLTGCLASIGADVTTFPTVVESVVGCAASYQLSRETTQALIDATEKISEIALECEFEETTAEDTFPDIPEELFGYPTLGWTYNPSTHHEYKLTNNKESWYDANQEARSEGGYLACINTEAENHWLVQNFSNRLSLERGITDLWIGLEDINTEGNYHWSDNTSIDYTNWAHEEPNNLNDEDCVAFYTRQNSSTAGLWNDRQCSNHETYGIIERPID